MTAPEGWCTLYTMTTAQDIIETLTNDFAELDEQFIAETVTDYLGDDAPEDGDLGMLTEKLGRVVDTL